MFCGNLIRSVIPAAVLSFLSFGSTYGNTGVVSFQDGSFESPTLSYPQVPLNVVSRVGQQPVTLPGWTSTTTWPGNPDTQNYVFTSSFDHVYDGSQAVLFNGDGAATTTLSQTFSTLPGLQYKAQFELSAQSLGINLSYNDVSDAHLVLGATGNPAISFADPTVANISGVFPYLNESYTFVASGSSTTLTFTQSDGNSISPLLDDVTVTPVPEPASLGICGLAVGFLRRRRRGELISA